MNKYNMRKSMSVSTRMPPHKKDHEYEDSEKSAISHPISHLGRTITHSHSKLTSVNSMSNSDQMISEVQKRKVVNVPKFIPPDFRKGITMTLAPFMIFAMLIYTTITWSLAVDNYGDGHDN